MDLEKYYNSKIDTLENKIEKLEQNVETLTEKLVSNNKEIWELKQAHQETEYTAKEAMRLGNHNEQYSRNHNFKIMGVNEKYKEKTWKLVQDLLKSTINVGLDDWEIIAMPRIPRIKGKP